MNIEKYLANMDNGTIMTVITTEIYSTSNLYLTISTSTNSTYRDILTPETRKTYVGVFILVGVLIMGGNLPFILTYLCSKSQRIKTNSTFFLVHLSIADFFVGLNMPYEALIISDTKYEQILIMCIARYLMQITPMVASVLLLCVVAVDRFTAVCEPLHYRSLITRKRAHLVVAGVWGISIIYGVVLPVLLLSDRNPDGTFTCWLTLMFKWEYFGAVLIPSFYIGTVLIAIVYGLMIIVFLQYQRSRSAALRDLPQQSEELKSKHKKMRQEIKLAQTSLMVLALFYICWGPFFVILSIQTYGFLLADATWGRYRTMTSVVAMSNSFLDAVIYLWRLPHYRAILRRLCGATERSQELSTGSMELSATSR